MWPTYPAILKDGKLDWGEQGPPPLPPGEVAVQITILGAEVPPARGSAMAAALEAIAEAGGPGGFGDPETWQSETRRERVLPGRDG